MTRPASTSLPAATSALVFLNVGVFMLELSQPTLDSLRTLVEGWGMIPREYALGRDLAPQIPLPFWATMVTSTFLHAGWAHLASNMVALLLLGHALERRLGAGRFLVVYVLTGALAGLAHVAAHPTSPTPTVGASGGISGIVGAYLSLLLYEAAGRPRDPALVRVPALILSGLWIANGMAELAFGWQAEEVAAYAHLGGFLIGLTLGTFERTAPAALPARGRPLPALGNDHDLRIPLTP